MEAFKTYPSHNYYRGTIKSYTHYCRLQQLNPPSILQWLLSAQANEYSNFAAGFARTYLALLFISTWLCQWLPFHSPISATRANPVVVETQFWVLHASSFFQIYLVLAYCMPFCVDSQWPWDKYWTAAWRETMSTWTEDKRAAGWANSHWWSNKGTQS